MPAAKLEEIFPTPWGILEDYRDKVQDGSYGAMERYTTIAIEEKFADVDKLSDQYNKHPSTIRKKLADKDVRYIVIDRKHHYFIKEAREILKETKKENEAT